MRTGLMVLPEYQRRGYVSGFSHCIHSAETHSCSAYSIASQLCKYIETVSIKHNLPIGVKAYASSAPVHEKLGYRTLEHLVIRDQREDHLGEMHYYLQEWTPPVAFDR